MTSTGVPDPQNPDQWLVEPWPADTSFGAVLHHFHRASIARLPADGSMARLLAFHQGLRVALEAAPIEDVTDQDQRDWREDMLEIAELSVTLLDQYLTHHGHDPQEAEDHHLHAVQHRTGTRSPEP